MKRAKKLVVNTQFKVCPGCGYTEGFHVMLSPSRRKDNRLRLCLICPMCADVYDGGVVVRSRSVTGKSATGDDKKANED